MRLSPGDLDRSFRVFTDVELVEGLFASGDGERPRRGFTGVLERSFFVVLMGEGERFLRFSVEESDRSLRLSTGDRSLRELTGDLERCFLLTAGDLERSRFGGGDRDFLREDFATGDARSLRSRCGDGDRVFLREAFATGGERSRLSRLGDGDRDFCREDFATGDSCLFLDFTGDLLGFLFGLSLRSRLLRSGVCDFLRSLRSFDLSRRLSLDDSFDLLVDLDLSLRFSFVLDSSRFLLTDLERSRRFSLDLFSDFFTLPDRLRSRRLSFDFN